MHSKNNQRVAKLQSKVEQFVAENIVEKESHLAQLSPRYGRKKRKIKTISFKSTLTKIMQQAHSE
jgi:hypothetical protein